MKNPESACNICDGIGCPGDNCHHPKPDSKLSDGRLRQFIEAVDDGAYIFTKNESTELISALRELQSYRSQWVSVKDRLPEQGRYLVITTGPKSHEIGNYYSDSKPVGWWTDDYEMMEVTHWMTYPPAPSTEANNG